LLAAAAAADNRASRTEVKVKAPAWRHDVIACMLMSSAHSIIAAVAASAAWELAIIHPRPPAALLLVTTHYSTYSHSTSAFRTLKVSPNFI